MTTDHTFPQCPDCGNCWGNYAVGTLQHYCRDGQRRFRPAETHAEREARFREDPYAREQRLRREYHARGGR